MRNLIMWNVVTLDGYFEGSKPWDLAFHGLVWGPELETFSTQQTQHAKTLVFGKDTYLGMAEYWTSVKDEPEMALLMNSVHKLVCSTTLESADWNNSRIVRDAVSELTHLKSEGEGDLYVFGSAKLSASLMKAGLFDEYRLCVAPVILGQGRRLFEAGLPYEELQLIESTLLKTGGLILKYRPKTSAPKE